MQRNSRFFRGEWQRMSYRPTIQTVGNAEFDASPVSVLAALSVCLLFQAYFILFTNRSASDIAQFSSTLYRARRPASMTPVSLSCGLTIPGLRTSLWLCAVTSSFMRRPRIRTPSTNIPGTLNVCRSKSHPSRRILQPRLCSGTFPPFLAIHGLMSRRF